MPARLRLGVIGCGLVAQVMHLPHLRDLEDRFEVAALCDLSKQALAFARRSFPGARSTRNWREVLEEPLDAVLVLTSGSHAPVAVAAAEAGLHIFVEKPLSFSVDEGREAVAAAERAGVRLMVGYMKRYDPAYIRLASDLPQGIRLVRITTLESPLDPYVEPYPLVRPADLDPDVVAGLAADDERRVTEAIATNDPTLRRAYRAVLLDSVVHELNGVRGLLGEPSELRFADVWGNASGLTATLRFEEAEAVFVWVDLPGIARYEQDWAFYAPEARATLRFASPFLRNAPTTLVREGGAAGTAVAWRAEHVAGYEEAFKRELVEFHRSIVEGVDPPTNGADALRDVALCQSIVRFCLDRRPVADPADPGLHASRTLY